MYVAVVPNRRAAPAILLRESYRADGKVKTRTLANLSHWPAEKVASLKRVLAGEPVITAGQPFEIRQSLPHGHVAAVLGSLRRCAVDQLLEDRGSRRHQLSLALIAARILDPASKLATATGLNPQTATSSLGAVLGLDTVDEDDLYEALDWLGGQQERIEQVLAHKHLSEGSLVLYDVSSSYLEGRHCELAQFGHNRDGKRGKMQIVYGLVCTRQGCPVAIEVFEGNMADPKTLSAQITKLKHRFGLTRVILVGDRGMLTEARLRDEVQPAGLDWITSLRAPAIQDLVKTGAFQPSLFDQRELGEITAPDYPGERLVVCRNPLLAEERRRKRQELLAETEAQLHKIAAATRRARRPLHGKDQIGIRVGKVLGRSKMGKHFDYSITEDDLTFSRKEESIQREADLDGFYIVRTSVSEQALNAVETVAAYKSLAMVERAFRCLKTVDLSIRPIYHRLARRVRAHVFLCMLAYYVEWHMRQVLKPLLFEDEDRLVANAERSSLVINAQRSDGAKAKDATKRTVDGLPVQSFQALLAHLATMARNVVTFGDAAETTCVKLTSPTPIQNRAFDLLAIPLAL
jgi:hypothetical protein